MTSSNRVKLLVYDEYKDGYVYNHSFRQQHGTSAMISHQTDVPLPGLSLFVSDYNTYAVKTADTQSTVYADVVSIPENLYPLIERAYNARRCYPQLFYIDGEACIAFVSYAPDHRAVHIGTGKVLSTPFSKVITTPAPKQNKPKFDPKSTKFDRVYKNFQALKRKSEGIDERADLDSQEFNRHSNY